MPLRRSLRRALGALFASSAFALAVAHGARAEQPVIYKWVDENGVAHYTTDPDRIPKEVRPQIERSTPAEPSGVAAEPHPEDVMRDAYRTAPAMPAPPPLPVEREPVAQQPVEELAPAEPPAVSAPSAEPAAPVAATAPAPEPLLEEEAPAPLAVDVVPEPDPVSAPPPAPEAPLPPQQAAQLAEIDGQIEKLEGQIAQREEKLAALISTADDQRTTPLVDDPSFREISQTLPKLQSELQALRERRNKIQPATATP